MAISNIEEPDSVDAIVWQMQALAYDVQSHILDSYTIETDERQMVADMSATTLMSIVVSFLAGNYRVNFSCPEAYQQNHIYLEAMYAGIKRSWGVLAFCIHDSLTDSLSNLILNEQQAGTLSYITTMLLDTFNKRPLRRVFKGNNNIPVIEAIQTAIAESYLHKGDVYETDVKRDSIIYIALSLLHAITENRGVVNQENLDTMQAIIDALIHDDWGFVVMQLAHLGGSKEKGVAKMCAILSAVTRIDIDQ